MIGSSDGKAYQSLMDVELGRPLEAPATAGSRSEKATGASKSKASNGGSPELHIDRTKDVPLAASALHKDGEMYGVAIDKDAPIRPEYDQYIAKHESDEFHYMKDLIKNGMHPTEAYHKAHDHITPMESERVKADLGEKGLDEYKQYWRDVAKVSGEKENPDRHPDAHTSTYGLDEAELGKKFAEVVPLHPPGTFFENTWKGDILNEVAKKLGIPPPDNIKKFPKQSMNDEPLHRVQSPFQHLEETHGIEHTHIKPITPLQSGTAPVKLPIGSGKVPESIYTPAVRHQDGSIHTGDNHGEAYRNSYKETGVKPLYVEEGQGFITSKGRFVSRKEAAKIAKEARQITHEPFKGELTSEDLDPDYVRDWIHPGLEMDKFKAEVKEKYQDK